MSTDSVPFSNGKRIRRVRPRSHRWGGLGASTTTASVWSLLLLALLTGISPRLLVVRGVSAQQQNATSSSGSVTTSAVGEPEAGVNNSSDPTTSCANLLANGGLYAVSAPGDVAALTVALAGCPGGRFNVTWTGLVVLDEPLVVTARSSMTITGFPATLTGEPAALDGGNVTGLLELETGSSLYLDGVVLQNARRQNSGNGGAVKAESTGSIIVAKDAKFEDNVAVSSTYEAGRGGALALGAGVTARMENCTFVRNQAGWGGGVATIGDAVVDFENCLLDDNAADYSGGAVGADGRAMVSFTGSTVSNNKATNRGGALYGINATVIVDGGSMFVGNAANGTGGGIYLAVSFLLQHYFTLLALRVVQQ